MILIKAAYFYNYGMSCDTINNYIIIIVHLILDVLAVATMIIALVNRIAYTLDLIVIICAMIVPVFDCLINIDITCYHMLDYLSEISFSKL